MLCSWAKVTDVWQDRSSSVLWLKNEQTDNAIVPRYSVTSQKTRIFSNTAVSMVFRAVYFGNGLGINISRKKFSFITFRAKWSTRFIIPDNNRCKERYRNFSLRSECLLLLHLSYVLPQNDAIFDTVPVYKEQKKKPSRTRTRTRCPLCKNKANILSLLRKIEQNI